MTPIWCRAAACCTVCWEQRLVDYHFQPIVEVSTGRIFAYEALMRPRTPELSSPLAVLELARQEGKLRAVETLTWHTAMGAFAAHCRAGHVPEGCRVFINSLSNQAMLPEDTARFHREYRDYLSRVVLELTEVTRIDADLQAVKMQALMRSGGKLALDDYGSGYNGEAMLLAVQPDYVKIDVAIVRGVDQDDDKRQLVENLVSYAHVRGIALVGEGVETRAELEALAALGVDYVQGYFLARRLCCRLRHARRGLNACVRCAGKWIDRRRAEKRKTEQNAPARPEKAAGALLLSFGSRRSEVGSEKFPQLLQGGFFVFTAYFYGHGLAAFGRQSHHVQNALRVRTACAASDDDGTGRFWPAALPLPAGRMCRPIGSVRVYAKLTNANRSFPAAQNCAEPKQTS